MFQVEPGFRTGRIEIHPPGSEWWVQMAGTVVWGLSFSTLLTLFLTPSALAAPAVLWPRARRVWRFGLGLFGWRPQPRPGPGLPEAAE